MHLDQIAFAPPSKLSSRDRQDRSRSGGLAKRGPTEKKCTLTPVSLDRQRYLQDLKEIALREECAVHAYVLMTNHVHLLVTPADSGQVARLMQSLGRRYVRYVNDQYRRTGTFWEGRYKSSLVDRDTYLLHCYRYIELNPVRARMCSDPADYPWSSHGFNALGHDDPLIHPHPNYQRLGATREQRCSAYRAITIETLSDEDILAIRLHLQRQHALGSDRFRSAIEVQLARPAAPIKLGGLAKRRATEKKVHSDPSFGAPSQTSAD